MSQAIGRYDDNVIAAIFKISALQARILRLFLDRPLVTKDDITPFTSDVSVFMHRLRDKLSHQGIPITAHRAIGYSLSPEGRDALRAKVERFVSNLEPKQEPPPPQQFRQSEFDAGTVTGASPLPGGP